MILHHAIFLGFLPLVFGAIPKTVKKGAAKHVGGGRPDMPGHLKPMQELKEAEGVAQEIEGWPSPEQLFSFYQQYTPAVFRGALLQEQPFQAWDDVYLKEKFGHMVVDVEEGKVEDRQGPEPEDMALSTYLDEYLDAGYDKYLVQDVVREQLQDWTLPPPLRCPEMYKGLEMAVMWFSGGGTSSVLHSDPMDNLLCLLDGSKYVMLIHPDQSEKPDNVYWRVAETSGTSPVNQEKVDLVTFPRFAEVNWTSATLRKGDCMYIPHRWLHQVRSSNTRNLAVNLWWSQKGKKNKLDCKKRIKKPVPLSRFKFAGEEWLTSQDLHELRVERRQKGLAELSRDELIELLTPQEEKPQEEL